MMKRYLLPVALAALALAAMLSGQAPGVEGPQGGAPQAGRGGRGGRGPNFPQQTRQLAPPDVIARGKAVYGVNCTACHGADLRGGDQGGPSLLRSLDALSDQHGEVITPIIHGSRQDKGMPAFNLPDSDCAAIAEYIHSVLAKVGSQARPPGAADPANLNILVGDPAAGAAYFRAKCAGCHSVEGDLKGIATKYADARTLQNTWVTGGIGGGRGGFPGMGPPAKPSTVAVTFADGQKLEGVLVRKDDFIVTLMLPDGSRRSIPRDGDNPTVALHDPNEAHKKLAMILSQSPDDKDMHDVTAYLATIK